jgi:hypothetical protein
VGAALDAGHRVPGPALVRWSVQSMLCWSDLLAMFVHEQCLARTQRACLVLALTGQ